MVLGNERGLLIPNPLKRAIIHLVGDVHYGRVLRFMYLKHALQQLALEPSAILDAGSGKGYQSIYLAKRYPKAQVTGFDVNEADLDEAERVREASHLSNVTFARRDLQTSLGEQNYDLIVSWEVLECVPDDICVLRNFYQALRPGGVCLLHVMHSVHAYARVGARRVSARSLSWGNTGQVRAGYTETELEAKLKCSGFERVELDPTFGSAGMFAHSLFEVGRRWPTPVYLLLFPWLVLLGHLDVRATKPRGGAILGTACKE